NDIAAHTVTADNTTGGTAVFDSSNLAVGASYSYTFTAPGTYTYHCNYHSWMKGTVVVKPGSSSSSSSASALKVSIPVGAGNPSGAPGYAPDKITLVIGVNNTVTWTNDDGSVHHTVTSTSVPSGATGFNSGDMAGGATFTYTFTVPGTYQYDCVYHPWMTGTITVVAAP
ncbi:MAG: cupredoxin domain-containing protein, partial [Thaumarchaeota archaeon]|nr:cupredoxin domain-containing protein [Nitrososphaerota archaeon]